FARARGQHDDRHPRRRLIGPQDAAHFDPAHDGQVQIEDQEIRRAVADRSERRVAGPDDLGVRLAAPLERVLDETGDIAFVFGDEDAMSGHELSWSLSIARVAW